jgi:acetolactate synthase-1/2/3 large subunit
MVTQWQNIFYEDRYAHTHSENPDFIKLADAMGIQARRCIRPDDVIDSLKWLIESDGPAFLEVVTDKKVPVLPMVPSGNALHEVLVFDPGMFSIYSASYYANNHAEKDKERLRLMAERTEGKHGVDPESS